MLNSLFTSLINPIIHLAGESDKSLSAAQGKGILDFNPVNSKRRQAAFRLASLLVNRLEKEDGISAVTALYRMHAQDRVFVAETMLSINRQHRSIDSNLPRFHCAFVTKDGKRTDLTFVEISNTSANGSDTSNNYSFKSAANCFSRIS